MERYDQATRLAEVANKPSNEVQQTDWHKLSGGYHFGRRPFVSPDEHKQWNFLHHHVPEQEMVTPADKGLTATKFHKGFHRRTQHQIQQSRDRELWEAEKEARKERVLQQRRKYLEEKDKANHINLFTGEFDAKAKQERPRQRKYIPASVSESLKREGDIALRTSENRFYLPAHSFSGQQRKQKLMTEGIDPKARYSSVLGFGSKGLPSHGVADNFNFAQYEPGWRDPALATPRSAHSAASVEAPRHSTPDSRGGTADVRGSSSNQDKQTVVVTDPDITPVIKSQPFVPKVQPIRRPGKGSVLTQAARIQMQKQRNAYRAEVDAVRNLP